ncbi:hypothetical protein DM02DRAFT_676172 [Periconia macrospinosa]|uniref:Calcineurin-like phosphoesterase domain-containing protein n=1 Tax=Periconia macrospinosa TaxID=97972 RepID=A0A2V1DAB4_9PLEO|nr:hypothetical protein DM02DRAFT_676172 [Periconia macrospinosa]
MASLPLQLQIIADLRLETPIATPSYQKHNIDVEVSNPCLFGDIEKSQRTRIFYIIDNHKAYQTTFDSAVERLRSFEEEAKSEYGGRFILLDRTRFDLDSTTTLLGYTLWTAISSEQAAEARLRLTDFNEQLDRDWLNDQVRELEEEEPHRRIAILTHHSPPFLPEAIDPRHRESTQSTCFATDLSSELCWTSPMVRLWAFGHSCDFRDEQSGKLLVANQKGYHSLNGRRRQ